MAPNAKEIQTAIKARLQELSMERRELERAEKALDPNRRLPGRPRKEKVKA
jgi:hypothetical protein